MKRPNEGDWISHRHLHVNGEIEDREGMVVSVLSVQFTYETDAGGHYYCLFSEDWKPEGEAPWLR